jgi:hypothetical protein
MDGQRLIDGTLTQAVSSANGSSNKASSFEKPDIYQRYSAFLPEIPNIS